MRPTLYWQYEDPGFGKIEERLCQRMDDGRIMRLTTHPRENSRDLQSLSTSAF